LSLRRIRASYALALVAGCAALLAACNTPAPELGPRPAEPYALAEASEPDLLSERDEYEGGGQERRATASYAIYAPAELGQGSPAVAIVRATFAEGAASAVSASAVSASAGSASAASAIDSTEGLFEGLELFVRSSDGRTGRRTPLVVPPRRSPEPKAALGSQVRGAGPSARPEQPRFAPGEAYALAAFGLATGAAPGQATIYLARGDEILAQASLAVVQRSFRLETLRLNQALTSIRVDPDPEKTAQAERYLALLASVNPEANYLDGGFIPPVHGTRRTSLFGDRRRFVYADGSSAWGEHNGVDYGYPTGTPIYAPAPGRVVMAEDRIVTGQTIVLEHLPGVYTVYMHLSRMDLAPGQIARRGQSLGAVGATGLATGPHLHWELRILGVAADPEAWIGIDKVPDIRTIADAFEGG
jgi:murein DD-endopeptidase MepM/ murein hydrolase activator NlpD